MHPLLNIAIRAARAGGNVIVRNIERLDTLHADAKGPNDFVSDVDREAERRIIETIHHSYPNHAILAEESGAHAGDDYEWIIDPLDGTTNYLHGFPHFAVSIGLRHRGRFEQAVVFDPVRQELFTATRGEGARLDDRRIRVSDRPTLEGALIGTGFPFRSVKRLDPYLAVLRALIPRTAGFRRAGSAALDLAYVAAGRVDAFFELDLSKWDVAAGILLVQEAGGLVTDIHGGEDYFETGDIVAGNSRVVRRVLACMAPAMAGAAD